MTYHGWDTDPWAEIEAEEDERRERAAEADREMAELVRAANAMARARKAGRCCHASAVGYLNPPVYPEQEGLRPGQMRCTEGCGAVFDSDEAWYQAMADATERTDPS